MTQPQDSVTTGHGAGQGPEQAARTRAGSGTPSPVRREPEELSTIARLEAENVVLRADRDVAVSVAWNLRRGSSEAAVVTAVAALHATAACLEAERDRLKGALERVAVEVTCESFGRIKCVRCFVFDGAHDPMCPTLIAARALATPGCKLCEWAMALHPCASCPDPAAWLAKHKAAYPVAATPGELR